MMRDLSSGLLLLLLIQFVNASSKTNLLRILGPQGVNLWNLDKPQPSPHTTSQFVKYASFLVQDEQQAPLIVPKFRARWFEQPLDHFDKDNTHTFHQRYWVNDRHYRPSTNAPVIVIDGGETSGEVRRVTWGPLHVVLKCIGCIGPFAVLGHRNCGNSRESYRWCWCRAGTQVLWYVFKNFLFLVSSF